MKFFPIMAGPYARVDTYACVPWGLVEPHERQALSNHGQSLQRLAERGGLAWSEMLAVIEDREFRWMEPRDAAHAVMARLMPRLIWAALPCECGHSHGSHGPASDLRGCCVAGCLCKRYVPLAPKPVDQ